MIRKYPHNTKSIWYVTSDWNKRTIVITTTNETNVKRIDKIIEGKTVPYKNFLIPKPIFKLIGKFDTDVNYAILELNSYFNSNRG